MLKMFMAFKMRVHVQIISLVRKLQAAVPKLVPKWVVLRKVCSTRKSLDINKQFLLVNVHAHFVVI